MNTGLRIGLFGYGVVGHGVYDILSKNEQIGKIVKICVKDRSKKRDLPQNHFTYDKNEILESKDINLIVEVIDDAEAAFEIVIQAMKNGKNVISANKKMIAQHWDTLIQLQKQTGVSFLYEASCCGSIPIIRNLEEYSDNELLYSVSGIFSGSCNYILTRMFQESLDFDIALKQAQDMGFVEKDAFLDLTGLDASYKLIIICSHAYGVYVNPQHVLNHGILNLSSHDVQFAKEKGLLIKLVSYVGKIDNERIILFTLPHFVDHQSHFHHVNYENNAVLVEAVFSDKQLFIGKGAGAHPTGSAVLSDISANRYDYKYEYKKFFSNKKVVYSTSVELEVYFRYYDEKNLNHFRFERITEKYFGKDFNYVIGNIKLDELLANKEKLNSADIQVICTGKIKTV
jgi:homoserine dehydrogenase